MEAGPFHSLWHFDGRDIDTWLPDALSAISVLQRLPGFVEAHVGHSVDDPGALFVHTTWVDVGSYRRALSSTNAKLGVWPWLADVRPSPSAYESLLEVDAERAVLFQSSVDGA